MSGYIYSIVCASAAIGIVCVISPEGSVKKHLRLVCALCLLCILIGPMSGVINDVKGFLSEEGEALLDEISGEALRGEYENIYEKYLENGYENNVGQAVKSSLLDRFGIPESECRVNVEFADKNGDGIKEPSKITVIFSGSSVFRDPKEIKFFVSELVGCECVCAVD